MTKPQDWRLDRIPVSIPDPAVKSESSVVDGPPLKMWLTAKEMDLMFTPFSLDPVDVERREQEQARLRVRRWFRRWVLRSMRPVVLGKRHARCGSEVIR